MNIRNLVLGLVLAAACSSPPRHVMTDEDVARRTAAQHAAEAAGTPESSWTDTEQNTYALSCQQWFCAFNACSCLSWQRNPPAGAFDCSNDKTAYSGEFLFSDMDNFGGTNCAGYNHNSNPGGLAALGDYNDVVRSVKNNTGVEIHGYRDPNFGQNVQFFPTNGQTITNLNSPYNGQMSSFRH